MRTARLFLDIFALALLMPLLLLACGGSDEPTDGPSSERATAEPTDLPDSERATDEPETPASPARTPTMPGSGAAPTATDAPEPATATAPSAASGSDETDREALVALYNATNGKSWWNSANWLSDAPIGEWYGVTTEDDGRVIALGLGSNELSGDRRSWAASPTGGLGSRVERGDTSELGSLSNLTGLDLSFTDLSGEIPSELGSLSNLTGLDLRYNGLSGEIPPELGSLSNLVYLDLSFTDLSGEIPPELGSLSNLTYLILNGNELSGCVPSSWEDRLNFDFSDLGGLPFC